jgi:GMP synthase-like glutamine amidotransferase
MKYLSVIQHTSADYLGLMEDHLEGRGIRFNYSRPFTEGAKPPDIATIGDGLVLLGGGPWGSAGVRDVPTLDIEIKLVRACLMMGKPILAVGLGAQILALAADGKVKPSPLEFRAGYATKCDENALNGFLPQKFPHIMFSRDQAIPPDYAKVLAKDYANRPAIFQIGENAIGFSGHPGFKLAMAEDLIMEFDENPSNDTAPEFTNLRKMKTEVEDALVPIMTGLIQLTGWMNN